VTFVVVYIITKFWANLLTSSSGILQNTWQHSNTPLLTIHTFLPVLVLVLVSYQCSWLLTSYIEYCTLYTLISFNTKFLMFQSQAFQFTNQMVDFNKDSINAST